MIFINEPHVFGQEYKYLKLSLEKNWISSGGSIVNEFEKKIKKYTKSKFAISCNSGTSALHIALKILTKKDDEVLVPSLTFISTINSINYNQCNPIFMDTDKNFNIDELKTIDFINKNTFFKNKSSYNISSGKKISALICVSVWGVPPKIDKLYQLCKKRNIKIIEDATEALGSFYNGGRFNNKHSGTIGDIGCLSFNGNKTITVGAGGMILTKNINYKKKASLLIKQCKVDSVNYIHDNIGYNYSLPAINAAFGLGQFINLNKILKKKSEIFNHYKKNFENLKKFEFYTPPSYSKNNNWMNIIILKKKNIKFKNKVLNEFKKNKIQPRSIWLPNHLQKPYRKFQKYKLANCQRQFVSSICLPSSYSLSKTQQNKVIKLIKNLDA